MHCLLAALLIAASPSYVLFSRGRQVAPGSVATPSGVKQFSARTDGLTRADIVQRSNFGAWLQQQGLSAVEESGDVQVMPVVIARGPRQVLAAYGIVSETENPGVFAVQLGAGIVDPHARAALIRQTPGVTWAEPDLWGRFETRTFDDPLYPNQWHLHPTQMTDVVAGVDIGADQAWLYTRGATSTGQRVIIAVLDDGFALAHPDLVEQYLYDGSGIVAKDFVDNDGDPTAQAGDGHGIRVMGAAAARGNNGIGISGVCPECNAIPVRIFTSGAGFNANALYGPMSVAADAMIWAADQGARVINNSWGPIVAAGSPTYQAMPQIVYDAITNVVRRGPPGKEGSLGVLITWAAGNNRGQVASFDGWVSDGRVMTVGAMNAAGVLSNYSEIGPAVRLLGPSSQLNSQLPAIYTTDGQAGYSSTFGGTSAATPIVAGAAALVLAKHPELTLAQLFEVLTDSAKKISADAANYGRDEKSCTHGYGAVDALAAIELADLRVTRYESGNTFHFELCGDGIDNDANPATSDACTQCIPTSMLDRLNGIDDDCDGYVDNPVACVPNGLARCETCTEVQPCAQDFACMDRGGDGFRCLRTCDLNVRCGYGETCIAGACLPEKAGAALECGPYLLCALSNGGVETCDDADNDCNGKVDDLSPTSPETLKQTGAFRRAKYGVCNTVVAECIGGRWVATEPVGHVEDEVDMCDSLDNDCDGQTDEGCPAPEPPASQQSSGCQAAPEPSCYAWLIIISRRRRR